MNHGALESHGLLATRCDSADALSIGSYLLERTRLPYYPVMAKQITDFCNAWVECLVLLRDRGDLTLTPDVIRHSLTFDFIKGLAEKEDIPATLRAGLQNYLDSLPGYAGLDAGHWVRTRDWHNSYTMPLQEALLRENDA